MKLLGFGMLLMSLLAIQTSFAATVSNTGISVVMIDRKNGAKVFVKTSVIKTANNPTCHTNTSWAFVLPLTNELEKAMYSAILAAKNTGKKVNLVGTGDCGTHTGIETLNRIEVL